MLDFSTEFSRLQNKRHYTKERIKDLDTELKKESKIIEEDPDKIILKVLHKSEEKIIVYRTIFDSVNSGLFLIDLKIIHNKGIVLNRVRLSANYTNKQTIELGDIEVFGENQGRGYGSILLDTLIDFARDNGIRKITGWISYTDEDHFDKLELYYIKHGFNVNWCIESNYVHKAADIIWTNQIV